MKCHFLTCDYNICAIDFANLFSEFSFKENLKNFSHSVNIWNCKGFSCPRNCVSAGREQGRQGRTGEGRWAVRAVRDARGWAGDAPRTRFPHGPSLEMEVSHGRIGCGKRCPSPSLLEKCTRRQNVGTNGTFLVNFIRTVNAAFHIGGQRQVPPYLGVT